MHCEYPDGALKTVKKLSVELWTLLALNGRHLGYVAEGEGPLFKLEMAAEYVVTTVNIATLYKCKLYMCFLALSTTILLSDISHQYVFWVNLAVCNDLVARTITRMLTLANANLRSSFPVSAQRLCLI